MESNIVVTPDLLVYLASIVLSLLFSYVPKLNTWYAAKSDEFKKLLMLLLIFLTTVILFLLSCFSLLSTNLVCTKQGIFDGVMIFILAIVANQSVFTISPKAKAVKKLKEEKELARLVELSASTATEG
jgi:preprotein translocase subunit SecY